MTYEDCLKATINHSVSDVLDRLNDLQPEERYHLLMEWFEVVACPIEVDEVLMVPQFQEEGS